MQSGSSFDDINEAKTDMEKIYDQPDPRRYFGVLDKLGYVIPGKAKPIFDNLISHIRDDESQTVRVLDLGCSYGVNAALLKHDLSMPDLYEHWGQKRLAEATSEEVIEYDRRFFNNLEPADNLEVVGLDASANALEFAEEVGLLDDSLAVNLESEPLPAPAVSELAPVDLVVSTGCVGYVTEKTFERLLPAVTLGQKPWLANFVLRMFPFDPIAAVLKKWGYVTEKLEDQTFVQREFTSAAEQERVVSVLREQGVDIDGKEAAGELHAAFYLSRPNEAAAAVPLQRLVPA